ncbi:MAG: hypothetical protein ACRDWS_10525 [Acidimicrobiia bacterium]
MSRAGIVALVLAVAALGVAAAVAPGLLGGEDDAPETQAAASAGTSTTVAPVTSDASTASIPAPVTTRGEDPLCAAHANLQAAVDGHLPVEGAEDLQIVATATVAFYTKAVNHVDPPERDAFAQLLVYEQASYDYSEANDWNPSRPLSDLLENPPPSVPQGATAVVIQVMEERCDVVVRLE